MTADEGSTIPLSELQDVKNHVAWRRFIAEQIARQMDMEKFGVREVYLIGSTEMAMAGMGSDIDLLIYTDGDAQKKALLELWLDGWSKALALMNYVRTGCETDRLLDVHIVTDKSIQAKDSFAIMMKSTTESSRLRRRNF